MILHKHPGAGEESGIISDLITVSIYQIENFKLIPQPPGLSTEGMCQSKFNHHDL